MPDLPPETLAQALAGMGLPLPVRRERVQVRIDPEGRGRRVERLTLADGRPAALKWRDDRPDEREGWLYANLPSEVLAAYGAPQLLGRFQVGAVHGFVLEWCDGTPADYAHPAQAARVAAHVGAAHAATQKWAASVTDRRLLPDPVDAFPDEPLIFDSGDLNALNFLLTATRVHTLDFEGAAIRRRARAVTALPRPALRVYWESGWRTAGEADWRRFHQVAEALRVV